MVILSAAETLFDDPYFGRLILGVSNEINEDDMTLSLFLFGDQPEGKSIISRVVAPGLVDGVIVTATNRGNPIINHLQGADLPFVVVGRPDSARSTFCVDVDNRGGARAAALHLAGLGRRRPALISAPSNTSAGVDRRNGFLEGLSEAGLSVDNRIGEGDWSQGSGREEMARLLAERPDSVFVASDRMAVGALRAINEAGLNCPQDISLVSFDGLVPPDLTMPRLSSVLQPVTQVGRRAVRLLRSVIDGTSTTPEHVVFPTELAIRESCGSKLSNRSMNI